MAAPAAIPGSSTYTGNSPAQTMYQGPPRARLDWLGDYPPPRSLPLDQEAQRIYERAHAIGVATEPKEAPAITYGTVLAALLTGGDATSRWFAELAKRNGPHREAVFKEKDIAEAKAISLSTSAPPGRPHDMRLSGDNQLLTISSRAVLENAERWALRVGASDIGVRHLVAAYVLNPPPAHRKQMQRWGYQEAKWRPAFFDWVAERYTAEQWTDASHRPAPTKTISDLEQQEIKGDALAFPGDAFTRAVLDAAAELHARRGDDFLRLLTVFHALIDTARTDPSIQGAIGPIWTAVQSAGEHYDRERNAFLQPGRERPPAAFSQLNISTRVLNALETARELAVTTHRDAGAEIVVGVLHLAGALLSTRVDGDQELEPLGLEPQRLRRAVIEHAERLGEPGEVWREALRDEETVVAGRPVELNSDEPEAVVRMDREWSSDPLGIKRDVATFAALLASDDLEPPLSIGLFGPWGSGKTTFLRRLRRAVDDRADDARKAIARGEQAPFVANVVQIDFNAWHFAEGALTSSLVDTIFRALSDHIRDDRIVAGKEWRRQKLAALESTQRKVEAAKAVAAAAEAAVAKAESDLETRRQEAARATIALKSVVGELWSATRKSLESSSVVQESGVLDRLGEGIDSAEELRARLQTVRTRPARLIGDLGWGGTLMFATLVLAVPVLVTWVVGRLFATGEATTFLSFVGGMLAVVVPWIRAASGAVAKVDQALAEVAKRYDEKVDGDAEVIASRQALESAQARAATTAAGLEAARGELARAQIEVANAELPAQMLRLVSSRIDAESYSRELTTLSLARADLEALSLILRGQREDAKANGGAPTTGGSGAAERAVDRVILYIDDLDRCSPGDVVRVLQIVHMLLAFELFVVVVAVDPRWVEHSLRQSYPWLRPGDGRLTEATAGSAGIGAGRAVLRADHVTPQDYLEKIFQIAFWLEPMSRWQAAKYLTTLMPGAIREAGNVTGVQPASATGGKTRMATSASTLGEVSIYGIELDYMRALSAYVGSSPRRVKRLVNAYRLIKAGMSDAELEVFLTEPAAGASGYRSGPYQLAIGLLVIATGAPASSGRILRELSEWDPGAPLAEVVEEFRKRKHPDWTMAAQVIEMLMQTQKSESVSELRGWARRVGRFMLERPAVDTVAEREEAASAPGIAPEDGSG